MGMGMGICEHISKIRVTNLEGCRICVQEVCSVLRQGGRGQARVEGEHLGEGRVGLGEEGGPAGGHGHAPHVQLDDVTH